MCAAIVDRLTFARNIIESDPSPIGWFMPAHCARRPLDPPEAAPPDAWHWSLNPVEGHDCQGLASSWGGGGRSDEISIDRFVDPLYTRAEAARFLGVTEPTFARWDEGDLLRDVGERCSGSA